MSKQIRNSCPLCHAEWWYTIGSKIHPRDHCRPDNRNCSLAKTIFNGKTMSTQESDKAHKRWLSDLTKPRKLWP